MRACKRVEDGGEQAQAQGEHPGVSGTAVQDGRFGVAGPVGARPAAPDFPGDERPRHGLGPAENGKHEEADGIGAAGSALGEQRQGEKCRRDARECPPVLQRALQFGASIGRTYPMAVFQAGG